MKRNFSLTFIVVGFVFFLILAQLFITHRLAMAGERVREFEVKTYQLERENVLLEEEISQMGSLSQIAQKAEEMGFVQNAKVVYYSSQVPVAWGTSSFLDLSSPEN